jgi:hypothetical protein
MQISRKRLNFLVQAAIFVIVGFAIGFAVAVIVVWHRAGCPQFSSEQSTKWLKDSQELQARVGEEACTDTQFKTNLFISRKILGLEKQNADPLILSARLRRAQYGPKPRPVLLDVAAFDIERQWDRLVFFVFAAEHHFVIEYIIGDTAENQKQFSSAYTLIPFYISGITLADLRLMDVSANKEKEPFHRVIVKRFPPKEGKEVPIPLPLDVDDVAISMAIADKTGRVGAAVPIQVREILEK